MLQNTIKDTTHHSKISGNVMGFGTVRCLCLVLGLVTSAEAQHLHARLSEPEFVSLAGRCAPGAPADTLLAIARTESGLYANAISINRPRSAARRAGHGDGELVLAKEPKDRTEANSWLHWLTLHHYTVSIGLMQ